VAVLFARLHMPAVPSIHSSDSLWCSWKRAGAVASLAFRTWTPVTPAPGHLVQELLGVNNMCSCTTFLFLPYCSSACPAWLPYTGFARLLMSVCIVCYWGKVRAHDSLWYTTMYLSRSLYRAMYSYNWLCGTTLKGNRGRRARAGNCHKSPESTERICIASGVMCSYASRISHQLGRAAGSEDRCQ
jgi:hypothetical protein